jgi:peptidoglycan glycosyltransferase (EC 2.4.1.129)
MADPVPGCNVVLTIDSYLQNIAWNALEEKAGSVIVMNPRDGSVMAMVSRPAFNPNLFNRGISLNNWEKLFKQSLASNEKQGYFRAVSSRFHIQIDSGGGGA